ncbi:MAG: hypothetical protein HQK63_14550 [Desulfamplus sp.]|nr:hypothetical protein [Desulfamplus sp.]
MPYTRHKRRKSIEFRKTRFKSKRTDDYDFFYLDDESENDESEKEDSENIILLPVSDVVIGIADKQPPQTPPTILSQQELPFF